MLSCSPGPGPVLAQGGRGSGPQNRRGSGCLAEAAAVGRGRADVEEAGDPSPSVLSGSPAALLMDNAADTCDTSKATLPPSTEQDGGWV